jgi:hypothetical protein
MPLASKSRIVGNHVWFVRSGAAFVLPAPGVAGVAAKPDAADAAWLDFGALDELDVKVDRETRKIFAPLPGRRRLKEIIETKHELQLSFTGQELAPITYEVLFKTLELDPAGAAVPGAQYNPFGGPSTLRVWLKIEQYDDTDTLINTLDCWGALVLPQLNFGDDVVKPKYEFTGLHSNFNSGTL